MNKLRTIAGLITLTLVIASCGSSNSVVSNGFIQKRKYNKGFFIKSKSHLKSDDETLAKGNVDEEKASKIDDKNSFALTGTNEVEVSQSAKDNVVSEKNTGRKEFFTKKEKEFAKNTIQKFSNNKLTAKVSELSDKITQSSLNNVESKGKQATTHSKASHAKKAGSMSTTELITLIIIIVLIILAFTLLNSLTNGWLGWLVGVILLVVLIVLLLRWLGVI